MGWCSSPKRCLLISFLFLVEAADLYLDWDFYTEIASTSLETITTKPGLKYSILGFAIFGSTTFVLGLVSLWYDARKDYSHLTYATVMSVISTWLEDIPQIILAVIVAVMSPDLISQIQLGKASYAIIEAVIHIILSFWQLCYKKPANMYAKTSGVLKGFIIFDLFGGFLILGCAVFLLIELEFDYFH